MEADFNYHIKLISGKRIMDPPQRPGMVTEELYNKENDMAKDAVLHQVLVYNLVL